MNVIRLGVLWAGVEPTRGKYNETYLKIIKSIVDKCNLYGIYVLLDSHQVKQTFWSFFFLKKKTF